MTGRRTDASDLVPPSRTRGRLVAWLVCCWIAFWAPVVAAGNGCTPAMLDGSTHIGIADIGTSMRVADAPPGAGIGDIEALPESAFGPTPSGGLITGQGTPVWLRLCLQRTDAAPDQWILQILPSHLRRIELHDREDGSLRTRVRDRDSARNDNDFTYRGGAFALTPSSTEASVYYVRVSNPRPVALDLLLLDPGAMTHFIALEYGGFGLYLGMMLLVAAINLMFWHRLRDPLYLKYALAVLSIATFAAIVGGYVEQFVPAFAPFYDAAWVASYAACAALMTRFVLDAFRAKLYYPLLYRAGTVLVASLAIVALLGIMDADPGFSPQSALRWLVFAAILAFGAMSVHALLRHRSVRLYAIAFLPLIAGLLSIAARRFGLADVPLADHLPNIGALVHVVLLNFALARRAERADRARQRAQQSALRAAQTSERMLEARVVERTRALDAANAQLHREITERTAAQERLHEALEAERRALHGQRQFIAMLSHELRTPLAVIDTTAQALVNEDADALYTRRINRIRRSVGRLVDFIENLLAEDRIASPSRMYVRPYDLRTTLRDRHASGERVRVALPQEPVEIVADPDLIGIVLSNLVDNALKYSSRDTPVDVALHQCGDRVYVEVADRGPGIAPDERERIFEKYYRAQGGHDRRGSGLGLYLCRELARRHGGDIELLPPNDAGGTTVRLVLPFVAVADTVTDDQS